MKKRIQASLSFRAIKALDGVAAGEVWRQTGRQGSYFSRNGKRWMSATLDDLRNNRYIEYRTY